ncbi:MAG: formylglycine-generating enzyme family protein [Hyphomicrobiaceae bacterium]|nr:formylglycine-generating enzyme family protein [Hyphomicrobiaceae bacterium]
MGSNDQRPEERHAHSVRVDGFWIDQHEVTNAQFREFVEATGHVTLAERGLDPQSRPGMPKLLLEPGAIVFVKPTALRPGARLSRWWQYVKGANWRQPTGPESSIEGKDNHPVVHIAYEDALAYAKWRGRSLPTEAQWEFAALGGRPASDDWSKPFDKHGNPIANTWQGIFPVLNTNDDGYETTAPVGCFPANGYGLSDMLGNVWEWTRDWYRRGHTFEAAQNPIGPALHLIRLVPGQSPRRVIKGGSYLCASNFCSRYRPSARQPQEVDLGAAHVGFRTILNRPLKEAQK